jgi:hypothetical protein
MVEGGNYHSFKTVNGPVFTPGSLNQFDGVDLKQLHHF